MLYITGEKRDNIIGGMQPQALCFVWKYESRCKWFRISMHSLKKTSLWKRVVHRVSPQLLTPDSPFPKRLPPGFFISRLFRLLFLGSLVLKSSWFRGIKKLYFPSFSGFTPVSIQSILCMYWHNKREDLVHAHSHPYPSSQPPPLWSHSSWFRGENYLKNELLKGGRANRRENDDEKIAFFISSYYKKREA